MKSDRSFSLKRLERDGHAIGFYGFSQKSMSAVVRRIWGGKLTVAGTENIPAAGPALLAMNQTTHLDPMFVALSMERPIHFVGLEDGGRAEPWYTPILYQSMGVISFSDELVRHGGHHFATELADAVRYGELIGIFPEGRIEKKSDRTQIAPFHKGVSTIARLFHLPVVPVLVRGTEDVIPNSTARLHERIYINPVSITVGSAIPPKNVRNAECVRLALKTLQRQQYENDRIRQVIAQGCRSPA